MIKLLSRIVFFCRLFTTKKQTKRLRSDHKKMMKTVGDCKEVLESIRDDLLPKLEDARNAIRGADILIKKTREHAEAVEEELRVANDVTIPGLVAANRLFVERWDAETQSHVARSAMLSGPMQSSE